MPKPHDTFSDAWAPERTTAAPASLEPATVLVGAGHAHVAALRSLARRPGRFPVTLVTPQPLSLYSGLLPSVIRRERRQDDAAIGIAPIARAARVGLLLDEVVGLDLARRILHLRSGAVPFTTLSFDIGARSKPLAGMIPTRPIGALPCEIERIESAGRGPVAVVGGGPAGVELSIALARRWAGARAVLLVASDPAPLPAARCSIRRAARDALAAAGVALCAGARAVAWRDGSLVLADGRRLACDAALNATGVVAEPFLAASGLHVDDRGCVLVDACLRSVSHAFVFAAGDCASFTPRPVPKGGVWAVRAGAVLAANLAGRAGHRRLTRWRPQRSALTILGLGQGRALGWRGPFHLAGRLPWWVKNGLDRRWMSAGR